MPSKLEELPLFIMFTLPTSVYDKAGQTGRARVNMLYFMWHQGPSDRYDLSKTRFIVYEAFCRDHLNLVLAAPGRFISGIPMTNIPLRVIWHVWQLAMLQLFWKLYIDINVLHREYLLRNSSRLLVYAPLHFLDIDDEFLL